jgi:hypothetical protein
MAIYLELFMAIWIILWSFGIFSVLVRFTKKNLATRVRFKNLPLNSSNWREKNNSKKVSLNRVLLFPPMCSNGFIL